MPGVETVNIRGPEGQPGRDGADATVTAGNIAAALGYTPADAEKVSKLSEEKADKKDIPAPYALPVAAADTLGGIKVGSDFVMDGETLKAKLENKYELIEEISFPEGCEIAVVERDRTPSGEPYAFKAILVTYSYHNIDLVKTGTISFRAYNGKEFLELTLGHGSEQMNNKNYVANQYAIVEHGKIRINQNSWSNYGWTGNVIQGQPRTLDTQSGVVSKIRISRGVTSPFDGFVFKIEGVRA
jgi:hypothetical protein